ncbi:MAG: DNA-binding response OmpR family regulator [Myxococcota bacterium]
MDETSSKICILIIEDNAMLLGAVQMYFEMEGYTVLSAQSGEAGLALLDEQPPDIAVVDIILEDGDGDLDGFETCREMRARGYDRPVLFLTGRTEESDTLQGFAVGGDDYVTKPFSLPVLRARVEAHLKRVGITQRAYRFGDIVIDLESHLIHHGDQGSERLRSRERDLLRCFIENRGRILSREQLLDLVWGSASRTSNRTVDTHVRTLRKKLHDDATNPRFIETMHGVGYQFIASADEGTGGL